jgi:hypothetical protein
MSKTGNENRSDLFKKLNGLLSLDQQRQLAIDRAGGPDAFKAAEVLALTMQCARKGQ